MTHAAEAERLAQRRTTLTKRSRAARKRLLWLRWLAWMDAQGGRG